MSGADRRAARSFAAASGVATNHDHASCRAAIDSELNAKLANLQTLIAAGKRDEARQLLGDIDPHYGGLAAPRIIELEALIANAK